MELEQLVEQVSGGDPEMEGTARAIVAAVARLVEENARLAARVRELGGAAADPSAADPAEALETLGLGGTPFAGDDIPDAALARLVHERALLPGATPAAAADDDDLSSGFFPEVQW